MLARPLVACALLAAAVARTASPTVAQEPHEGLVVHEWGTFTSMQGSDGIALEGLQHEEEALPAFVYSRSEVRACPLRNRGYKGLECDVVHVTRKMETPVIYFYARQATPARVRVEFERGLLTQWFPVSDLLGPPELGPEAGPLDLGTVEKSFLEWDIEVLPPGTAGDALPAVGAGDPWGFQRLPDANLLRTSPRVAPRIGPVETEKFLFYRGLGTFELPLRARTLPGSELVLENDGDDDLVHLFVVHVQNGRGAFSYAERVPAHGTLEIARPDASDAPSVGAMVERLIPALEEKLVAAGLYPKEATAMARTWERSYFHTEGLRVLYVVPRALTDRILPLEITPAPSSLVRVLVGRLECLTPEREAAVEQALRDLRAKDPELRRLAQERLDRLGRFLEPHLRRAMASGDEVVRESARVLLAGD